MNAEKILDCLYKYSDLQISYGINMVAIADGQPKLLNLLQLLDYYIAHQKKVVSNRLVFDKEAAEEKAHQLEGLMKAVLDIDRPTPGRFGPADQAGLCQLVPTLEGLL